MAKSLDKVKVELIADNKSYEAAMAKAMQTNKKYGSSAGKHIYDRNKQLSGSFRNAASSVAVLDGPLGGVAGRISALGSVVSSTNIAIAATGVAVAGLTAVSYKAVNAFAELEKRQFRTEALIKATGFSAGFTAEHLDEMARSTALNTLASTTQIREAQDVLLTFRSVSGPVFEQTIKLSQDMAVVMGGTAKTAALQLGKALEDPVAGLTALKRSGVSFTETEKEMIRVMAETNRLAEAQGMILEKVALQVGGAGKAEAAGIAGGKDTLAQRWEEFLEALGKTPLVSGAANASLQGLSQTLKGLTNGLAPSLRQQIGELIIERRKIKAHLDDIESHEGRGISPLLVVNEENYRKELGRVEQEISALQDKYIEGEKKKIEAYENGQEAQKKIQQERQASILKTEQETSQKLLSELSRSLASREEIVQFNYQKRLEQIRQLTLSQVEIERQGYQTLEQLQAAYTQKAAAMRDQQLSALSQKTQKNLTDSAGHWEQYASSVTDINSKIAETSTGWTNSFSDSLAEMVTTGKASFGDLAKSIVSDLIKIQMRAMVTRMIMSAFGGSFGAPTATAPVAHTGGIIGGDSLTSRTVSPGVFAGAPKYHTGGIAGDEVPAILQNGEGVFTKAQMKALSPAGSGRGMQVNVYNNGDGEASVESGTDGNGMEFLNVIIEKKAREVITGDIARGQGVARPLEQTYGLARRGM